MTVDHIRNFVIIAHIDHGKSTLADRLLELTATVEKRNMQEQVLDSMDLERERGITIKMTPVTMVWRQSKTLNPKAQSLKNNNPLELTDSQYILNLIDTPGHVDFSYEVSRSLAAVEGAILLVDATKGVQAQTIAHLEEALRQKLVIIPAINKIDLPNARIEDVTAEIQKLLPDSVPYLVSAKNGTGVPELLSAVITRVPPPSAGGKTHSRALIFDSHYDSYKGVLAYVRVFDGVFKKGDIVRFCAQGQSGTVLETGVFTPDTAPRSELAAGSIGYIATGLKEPEIVRIGDTIAIGEGAQPLSGYAEPKPVVFASVFPAEGVNIELLQDAFLKLKLSDWALTFEPESSDVLGRGFRCGFLGSLHLEIVLERLRREFGLSFVATAPSVRYEVELHSGEVHKVYAASAFPDRSRVKEVREPWVRLSIFAPERFVGGVLELLHARRGVYLTTEYLGSERASVTFEVPLVEIISDFYDKLKSVSSGFASIRYEPIGYRAGDLVNLEILVAGEPVEALERIVPRDRAYEEGRSTVKRLKELLPPQLFTMSVQAAIGGKIIAREDVRAMRKDVTGYLYGGDVTRKRKLLEKQKKGKKKLKERGRVSIPHKVYIEILRRGLQ